MRTKMILAVAMVTLMMAISLSPVLTDNGTDAAVGDDGLYSYTLIYDSTQMGNTAQQETQLKVEGMTPISHASGTTTLSAVANEGSWAFNTTTGKGPFNSYYAAFDMTAGNRFYAILNPYDLTKTISGASLDPIANYNIMWVIPTIYWSTDANGNVTLTNNPNAGGTAYAHTIDGQIREYIAIGVYEGSKKTVDGKDVLTSQSGATPTASQTRAVFRTQAHNYTMDEGLNGSNGEQAYSMLWNFYQWTLYKLMAYTVMEGFNSQMIVGNGNVNGGNYTMTNGLTNTLGPYAGNPGDMGASGDNASTYGQNAVRLFIENAWGTVNDFVDGVVVNGTQGFYIDTSSTPTDSTTAGGNVEYIAQTLPASNFGSAISTNEQIWGIPTETNSSTDYYNKGTTDKIYTNNSGKVLFVGGSSYPNASGSVAYGLSCAYASYDLSYANSTSGARLAFVFGDSLSPEGPSYDVTIATATDYGTVSTSAVADVEENTVVTINGNTLTIGTTTITATPKKATSQYQYAFVNWTVDGNPITGTYTITSDTTITANFSRAVREYTVTIASSNVAYGTVSPASVPNVPYGTTVTSTTNTLGINGTTVTATPTSSTAQYQYAFSQWNNVPIGGTITGDTTITAAFTQTLRSYTITWDIDGVTSTSQAAYGSTPTHTTPSKANYTFAGWEPAIASVTGPATYTATFTPIDYTVTWNATGGTVSPESSVGNVETAVILPTPAKEHFTFAGWYTASEGGEAIVAPYMPSADITLYARWTPVDYTVTFDATTNGGTTDATTLIGNVQSPITLPTASKDGMFFAGWFTQATGGTRIGFANGSYYPQSDVTLYAQFTESALQTFSLNFDANGGYYSPNTVTDTSSDEGTMVLTIPDTEPVRYGFEFAGWATESDADSAQYQPGDTITVTAGETVTLYAVWEEETTHGAFKELIDTIPMVMAAGLLIGVVGAVFKTYSNGGTLSMRELLTIMLGATVCIIIMAALTVPLLQGL